ncbi:MAG: hypothetical protein R3B06_18305 [Kofleriaceae bacterium]
MTGSGDEALLRWLRDLALVELDALVSGLAGEAQAAVLQAHADELDRALAAARARAAELVRAIGAGDPLVALEAGPEVRVRDGGRDGAERVARRLAARGAAARALARLDDLAAGVYPRLVEVDRRRTGLADG